MICSLQEQLSCGSETSPLDSFKKRRNKQFPPSLGYVNLGVLHLLDWNYPWAKFGQREIVFKTLILAAH